MTDCFKQPMPLTNCHVTNALYLLVTETPLAIFTEAVEVQGLCWRQVDQSQLQRNLEGAQQQVYIGKDLPRSSHPSYNMILQLVYIYSIFNMQHIHTLENSTT